MTEIKVYCVGVASLVVVEVFTNTLGVKNTAIFGYTWNDSSSGYT